MPACIHGDVCREWMRQMGTHRLLSDRCPNQCAFFAAKNDFASRVPNLCPWCGANMSNFGARQDGLYCPCCGMSLGRMG